MSHIHDGQGIKTAAGRRVYDQAAAQSDRIQKERSQYPSDSAEFKRLTKKDLEVQAKGLADALALNPVKKAKSKRK